MNNCLLSPPVFIHSKVDFQLDNKLTMPSQGISTFLSMYVDISAPRIFSMAKGQ